MMMVVADPLWGPATCAKCGARIVWTRAEDGRRVPVDPEPHAFGYLIIGIEIDWFGEVVDDGAPVGSRRATDSDPPAPRWISHFATCGHWTP